MDFQFRRTLNRYLAAEFFYKLFNLSVEKIFLLVVQNNFLVLVSATAKHDLANDNLIRAELIGKIYHVLDAI